MRQPLTTVLGIVAIVLGASGALFVSLYFAAILVVQMTGHSRPGNLGFHGQLFMVEHVISILTKFGLITTGILLLRRSRLAAILLIGVLLFSLADSLITFFWLLPPVPAGLTAAGHAGRVFGRTLGMVAPVVFYLLVLVYLALPKTREEFGATNTAVTF